MADPLQAALARYLAAPEVAAWLLDPSPVTSVTLDALDNAFVYAVSFGVAGSVDGPARDVEDMLITTRITPDRRFALGVVFGLAQPHVFSSTPLMLGVSPMSRRFAVDLRATSSLEFMELIHFKDRKICCCFRNFLHTPDRSLPVVIRATLHAPASLPALSQYLPQAPPSSRVDATATVRRPHNEATPYPATRRRRPSSDSLGRRSSSNDEDDLDLPSDDQGDAIDSIDLDRILRKVDANNRRSSRRRRQPTPLPEYSVVPHVLGPVLMRAESFEAVRCPACGKHTFACRCAFENKAAYAGAPVFVQGWGHFTSCFAGKARNGRDGALRLTMWANVPALGETKVLERDLPAKNFLEQDRDYLILMRRKALHGLGLNVDMPRVDVPLISMADDTDFRNLHEQYVHSPDFSTRKRKTGSLASFSRVTYEPAQPPVGAVSARALTGKSRLYESSPSSVVDDCHAVSASLGAATYSAPRLMNEQSSMSVMTPFGVMPLEYESEARDTDGHILDANCAAGPSGLGQFILSSHPAPASEQPVCDLGTDTSVFSGNSSSASDLNAALRPIAADSIFCHPEQPQELETDLAFGMNQSPDGLVHGSDDHVPSRRPSAVNVDHHNQVASILHGFNTSAPTDGSPATSIPRRSSVQRMLDDMDVPFTQDVAFSVGPLGNAPLGSMFPQAEESQAYRTTSARQDVKQTTPAWHRVAAFNRYYTLQHLSDNGIGLPGIENRQQSGFSKRPRSSATIGLDSALGSGIQSVLGGRDGSSDERRHACSLCDSRFKNRGDLQRHIKIVHEKRKMYACDDCGKQFGHSGHLNRHKASHRGERRFVCDKCGFPFFQASHLASHIEHIHSDSRGRQHECSLCHLRVETVDALRAHLNMVHEVIRCPVESCGKLCGSRIELDRHSQTHDPGSTSYVEDHVRALT